MAAGKGVMPPDTEKKQSKSNHPRDWISALGSISSVGETEGLELILFAQYT